MGGLILNPTKKLLKMVGKSVDSIELYPLEGFIAYQNSQREVCCCV